MPDAVVVGSGPNGLAAAITVARAGRSVLVVERAETFGGGARSAELTEPGFVHDVCSAIHPLAAGSPFFSELPLADHGLELVHPDVLLAPSGRRDSGRTRANGEGHGRRARSGRVGLPEADRAARPGAGSLLPFLLGPRRFRATPSGPPGSASMRSAPPQGWRAASRANGGGALRRARGALDAVTPPQPDCVFRARARPARPRLRLADGARLPDDRGRARLLPPVARRRGRDRTPCGVGRRAASVGRDPPRPDAARCDRRGRPLVAGSLPAGLASVSLRPRCLQARLGARRSRAVGGGGVRASGNRAYRRRGGARSSSPRTPSGAARRQSGRT